MKTITALLVFFLLASSVGADSWLEAEGVVFQKTYNAATGFTTLKIRQLDGTKVNADCMVSDAMTYLCLSAGIGNPASGRAFCTQGYCSWVELEISLGG